MRNARMTQNMGEQAHILHGVSKRCLIDGEELLVCVTICDKVENQGGKR